MMLERYRIIVRKNHCTAVSDQNERNCLILAKRIQLSESLYRIIYFIKFLFIFFVNKNNILQIMKLIAYILSLHFKFYVRFPYDIYKHDFLCKTHYSSFKFLYLFKSKLKHLSLKYRISL